MPRAKKIEESEDVGNTGNNPGDVGEGGGDVTPSKPFTTVTFLLKNAITRVFSQQEHGKGFVTLADEFEESNKGIIISRKSE